MNIIGFYAGILAIILLLLSYKIVILRRLHQVGLGDGGFIDLQQAIRVQANFIEYVPSCLILLVLLANNDIDPGFLHLAGGILVVARILHAIGLSKKSGTSFGRYWGILLTWLSILVLSISNIGFYLSQFF